MGLLVDEMKRERADHLIEFLGIIRPTITTSNGILDEPNDDFSALFELSVKQLVTMSMSACLCGSCNAACQKLVEVHRHMRKLEQEAKEFQVKFLNAIKLSKAIAEKYDQTIGKKNHDEEKDDVPIHPTNMNLDMESLVDQIRTCLVGGKGMWKSMKGKWMNYVNLDKEFTRTPKHFPKQRKAKTKQRKKTQLESSKKGSHVLIDNHNDLVKIIKVEKDMLSPAEIETNSLGPQQEGIEIERRNSIEDETTRIDSPFDDNHDDFNDQASFLSADEIKLEPNPVNEVKQNVQSNETSVDTKGTSDEHVPHKAISRQLLSYRRRRAQHPNLSAKEFLLLGKNSTPGRATRPIEELKSTPQNKQYMKWRQSHGMTMSRPAYNKMRRELALKRQKILEDGGPFMPSMNGSIIPVRWVEKDGKLSYLGFEVNQHEDAMSCALCPDFKTKYKKTMSNHIKNYHIGRHFQFNYSFHVII